MAKVSEVRLTDFTPDPDNANVGTERGQAMIEDSIREDGAARSIVVDADNVIVAGNKTHQGAIDAGLEKAVIVEVQGDELVVVKRTDFDLDGDDGRARRYAYRDNRSGEINLAWDAGQLLADLDAGVDLSGLFSDIELEDILGEALAEVETGEAPEPKLDKGAELAEKFGVQVGQVWALGEHRLACGDCTDKAVVDAVMRGEKAVCMWTDPPYGVDYVGKTKDALTIEGDEADVLPKILTVAFTNAEAILIEGAPFYVAHPAGALQLVFLSIINALGWRIHEQLVWVKDSMVLGHSDYHYKHEPILYGWTPGSGRPGRGNHEGSHWYGDNSQVSVFEIPRPKASIEHPTMKPVELIEAQLKNSTHIDDIAYDPFVGSGTTLIACERLGRKCRAIEIEPKYCAVTIQRWVDLTGKEPKLLQ